jgi:crotonobetainyl-CoA:carnitine CoA-transferase CaiB-like acyl-CoA transferase
VADLGEHTREFLLELGFPEQRIDALQAGKVVR